jgi:hypothetical protein
MFAQQQLGDQKGAQHKEQIDTEGAGDPGRAERIRERGRQMVMLRLVAERQGVIDING